MEICSQQVEVMRRELKNLRSQMRGLRETHKSDVAKLRKMLEDRGVSDEATKKKKKARLDGDADRDSPFRFEPIGFVRSWYRTKNGTPRQPTVCSDSKATLRITLGSSGAQAAHALDGLSAFSHVWLIFVFHANPKTKTVKPKVAPPRAGGVRMGVLATRSPHRPCPVGMTLAKLDAVEGDTVRLSGHDLLDGTPVLDIKPYIPSYDNPDDRRTTPDDDDNGARETSSKSDDDDNGAQEASSKSDDDDNGTQKASSKSDDNNCAQKTSSKSDDNNGAQGASSKSDVARVPDWLDPLSGAARAKRLVVSFTPRAERDLRRFVGPGEDSTEGGRCELIDLGDWRALRRAIVDILGADPRSVYRKTKCQDRLYFLTVDAAHCTVWFDEDGDGGKTEAQVLKVKKLKDGDSVSQ